jgi:hypothetical protein
LCSIHLDKVNFERERERRDKVSKFMFNERGGAKFLLGEREGNNLDMG